MTPISDADLERALRARLGPTASFRPCQLESIRAALDGRDSLAVLPTGAGKSLAYMLPAAARADAGVPGVVVVVSPLLSLLRDQIRRCDEFDVQAESWTSATDPARLGAVERDLRLSADDGGPSTALLFTTPESLLKPRLRDALAECARNGHVAALAVDEAHCVSQWGHDFRPSYLRVRDFRDDVAPLAPTQALTATATRRAERDIVDALGLRDPLIVRSSLNRPNLKYEVFRREAMGEGDERGAEAAAVAHASSLARECRGDGVGIVYARTRDECDRAADLLADAGLDVASFHAGKSPDHLARTQRDWSEGDLDAVVATIAFGMGVDRPDVRWVAHWGPPATLEGYYQESGRAGRDGTPARCVLYAGWDELEALRRVGGGAEAAVQYAIGDAECRRKTILAHFGERREGTCGVGEETCDVCGDPARVRRAANVADRARERAAERAADDARAAAETRAEARTKGSGATKEADDRVATSVGDAVSAGVAAGSVPRGPRAMPGPQRARMLSGGGGASAPFRTPFRTPFRQTQPAGSTAAARRVGAPSGGAKRKFVPPTRLGDDRAKR